MEELFRFTLNRPANRTSAPTIQLQQTPFQLELSNAVPQPNAAAGRDLWASLQDYALGFIEKNLPTWITSLVSQSPPSPIPQLGALLISLQAVQPGADPTAWQTSIQTALANTNSNDLKIWNGNLADLFIALMIIRSIGPSAIDKIIRDIVNLKPPPPPPVPTHLQPAFAQILHDSPSLDELANLLRMVDLVTNSASIPLKTADDVKAVLAKTLVLPPNIFSRFEKPIHAVGFTDLLVVKQHIARYELGEVARIENILKGESRDHAQKHTLSNERDTVLDTSTQTETDQELTTTDHVSLQNEIDSTLQESTKVDAGVHVQYDGGSVKAQADLTVGYNQSSSESKKFASNVAKDITQKASKKVTQKVQQTITTKIIETFEETEDQSFDNKNGQSNVCGVYQWVEKVYLAQVFNYGKHMLFDIMVPEPAASLLLAAQIPPPNQPIPVPPDPLGTIKTDATGKQYLDPLRPDQLTDAAAANLWIGKYQVTGVEPTPQDQIVVADAVVADGRDQSHGDIEVSKTIELADGYYADSLNLVAAWFTGGAANDYQIDIQIGAKNIHIDHQHFLPTPHAWGANNFSMDPMQMKLDFAKKSISVSIKTISTTQVSINFEIVCKPAPELIAKWQLQAYEKIVAAWQKLEADYEEKISALQFQKGTGGPLGAADPETNRQIERTELKRSCIALLNHSYSFINGSDALVPKTLPPTVPPAKFPDSLFDPDLAVSEATGSWVRWFEQAFEWDKIGYVFYPYYWGRSSQWTDKLFRKQDDPLFLNFLQSGYARVVVPVRNGFEFAINFFLLTGRPWMGGGLPAIWDKGQNPLYLAITEEIKELTGGPTANEHETLYGDPWEIRLPATLIKLQDDGKLPMWKWDAPSSPQPPGTYPPSPPSLWSWSEDKKAEQNE